MAKKSKAELEKELVSKLYKKYDLVPDDVFKHKNYLIVSRSGIEKIKVKAGITIKFDMIKCMPDFACIHAIGTDENGRTEETFGSAKYGGGEWIKKENGQGKKFVSHGTTENWYIAEIAEKRAMSRIVLKMENLYEHGVFGEDEADDFNRKNNKDSSIQIQKDEPKTVDKPTGALSNKNTAQPQQQITIADEKPQQEQSAPPQQEVKTVPIKNGQRTDVNRLEDAEKLLNSAQNIDQLKDAWLKVTSWGFKLHPKVISLKNQLKEKFLSNG